MIAAGEIVERVGDGEFDEERRKVTTLRCAGAIRHQQSAR